MANKESRDNDAGIVKVLNYLPKHLDFRKNIIANDVEYSLKGKNEFVPVNENKLYIDLRKAGMRVSISDVTIYLGSTEIKEYDPFKAYFDKVKPIWNIEKHGDYIEKFAGYVAAKEQDRFLIQFKKWLVRTVICAIKPEYFNKTALILVHDKQNSGKTSWCRYLIPNELTRYYIENISLDKDGLLALCQNFICNLDELAALSRYEINSLKSTFSKAFVNVRPPYERRTKMSPRRVSFIGSTNRSEFLNDETGSVRWLPFEIDKINWSYREEIDINIVWSQAYILFLNGYKAEMTAEEILENEISNSQFQIITPEQELIQKYYSPGTRDNHNQFYTTSDFLQNLSERVEGRIKLNSISLGKALKLLGFEKEQRKGYDNKSYPVKGYYIIYNDLTTYYK